MTEHGLPVRRGARARGLPDGPGRRGGCRDCSWLTRDDPPLLFSAATRCSLGVVPALHEHKRTDVALVAFGDFAMADALVPAVTVVNHSGADVGRAAAARLAERIGDSASPATRINVAGCADPSGIRGAAAMTPRSPSTEVVIGLDLGTTSAKAVARDLAGRTAALVEASTPWTTVAAGTEIAAHSLLAVAVDLLQSSRARRGGADRAGAGARRRRRRSCRERGSSRPDGRALQPGDCVVRQAWSAGGRRAREPGFRSCPNSSYDVPGLPWDCQASLAKLLWLQGTGTVLTPAHRWASVPEWIVQQLGGDLVREPSLASRTGLIDQATGDVWAEGLDAAGLPATLLPPPLAGGESAGSLKHAGLPSSVQGAALTVAGHDHPVAAIGVGAVGPDELFNSSGTADVIARSLPGVLDDDRRELLVRSGLSAGAHVLPDTTLLLGGVRGGLLLRRVLGALGVSSAEQREAL